MTTKQRAAKRKTGFCTYGGCLSKALIKNEKPQLYCATHRDWYREYMRAYMRKRTQDDQRRVAVQRSNLEG